MRDARYAHLHIEGGQRCESFAPTMNWKWIFSYLRPKTLQIPHHLLHPVGSKLIVTLVAGITRLAPLEMRGGVGKLVINIDGVNHRKIGNSLRGIGFIGHTGSRVNT